MNGTMVTYRTGEEIQPFDRVLDREQDRGGMVQRYSERSERVIVFWDAPVGERKTSRVKPERLAFMHRKGSVVQLRDGSVALYSNGSEPRPGDYVTHIPTGRSGRIHGRGSSRNTVRVKWDEPLEGGRRRQTLRADQFELVARVWDREAAQ